MAQEPGYQATDQAENQPRESSRRRSPFRRSTLIWILVISGIVVVGRVTPFAPVRDFFGSFSWLTEQAIKITKDLFESYGYLTVFLAPLLENTLFLGALIPGTLVILLAGLAANDGLISFWPAVLLGISGAIIGDTISYGMGRYGWRWLGPKSRLVRYAEEMREPLLGHSVWLVLSYHFAGYSRLVGPAAAGFLRMPFRRWMLLDYIGVSIWVFAYMSAGYLMGAIFNLSLDDSTRNVRIFEAILFAFFIIAIVSVMRASSTQRKRQAEEAGDSTPA